MNFTRNLRIAVLMTVVTTVLLGVIYPLAVTGLAQVLFRDKANGQLIERNGQTIGSRLIGQAFTSPGYFHGRPSAAGTGYDAANSAGSNLGPTNKKLIDAVAASVEAAKRKILAWRCRRYGHHLGVGPRSAHFRPRAFQVRRAARAPHQRGRPPACRRGPHRAASGFSRRAARQCCS